MAMLMFGRKLRIPLDLLIGCPQEEPEDRGYPEYKRFRESVETVHNFACVHHEEAVNTKGRASVRHPKRRQKLPHRLRKKNSWDKEACDRA